MIIIIRFYTNNAINITTQQSKAHTLISEQLTTIRLPLNESLQDGAIPSFSVGALRHTPGSLVLHSTLIL